MEILSSIPFDPAPDIFSITTQPRFDIEKYKAGGARL